MEYTINKNGSIDIYSGSIALLGAYPQIDGIPLRPVRCEAGDDSVIYELDEGTLELSIDQDFDSLTISCCVRNIPGAHDVSPIGSALIQGCPKAFRQGFGIAGPSGFIDTGDTFESDGVIALGDTRCISLHVSDNSRYRNHFHVANGKLDAITDLEKTNQGEVWLPEIFISEAGSFSDALKACASDIACNMRAHTPSKPAFHWCSWYYLYHQLDQPTLESYLDGFSKYRDIAPFTHIQIDAGYFPSCGDWLEPNHRFPGGLKAAAESIKAAGYEPGIWIAPFMVGDDSKLFREHPDWVLKNADGSYLIASRQYNEPKIWGYRDSDYYVLDTSHPDAMEYIVGVFRQLREWGYTLYKTDFLLWGMHDSTKLSRHTPGKTSFEYFRDLMAGIRQAIGDESAWLGCIAPFMPSVGYVDMMRIAGDVGAQWEETGFGPVNMIQEIRADQYFNNVYWQNDPDAVLLRDFHIHLRPNQIEALAILQAICGGVITTSDPVHLIAEDRRKLLELIRPAGVVHAEYPYWQEKRDEEIITAETESGKLAYFFNPTPKDLTIPCDWTRILGGTGWHLRRLHGESSHAESIPYVTIPAQSGILFFASRDELSHEPSNMWKW